MKSVSGLLVAALLTGGALLGAPSAGATPADDPLGLPRDALQCDPQGGRTQDLVFDLRDALGRYVQAHVNLLCDVDPAPEPGEVQLTTLPTDCTSTAFLLLSYRWFVPLVFTIDAGASGLSAASARSALDASAQTWDAETTFPLFGASTAGGSASSAGDLDGSNQIGWMDLGTGGTIAWAATFSFSGVAFESDQAYNTAYTWSLSGEAGEMDLKNIATHEMGHTFGMGHAPDTTANECLTMYPYAGYAETAKRTLGDGDILGIRDIYGD